MTVLQVIKENDFFPLGSEFLYNEDTDEFIYNELMEEGDAEVSYTSNRYYRFSPSFYEDNKEIFNQVKLEEQDEKNENFEAEANSPAESKSENVYTANGPYNGHTYYDACNMCKELQREEVEEAVKGSQSEWNRFYEKRAYSQQKERSKSRSKDKRTARYAAIEQQLENWAESYEKIMTAFANSFDDIRDNMIQLKQDLR